MVKRGRLGLGLGLGVGVGVGGGGIIGWGERFSSFNWKIA
ncbi:hypothetical protein VDG1235_2478 [Verrucomicrobiia bacterium DG1235]|nr:hypothetical protein VDG1235_2478 [Verrucomicrobiae bacterium DG1235]